MKEHFILNGKEIKLEKIEDNDKHIKFDFFDMDNKSITENIGFIEPASFIKLNSFKDVIIKEFLNVGGKHFKSED